VLAPFGGLGAPAGGLGRPADVEDLGGAFEPDMFGQFLDDVGLPGAPFPAGGVPVGLLPSAGGFAEDDGGVVDADVDALVVTTCGLDEGVENAKAAAVPPPTIAAETPSTAIPCFNLKRIEHSPLDSSDGYLPVLLIRDTCSIGCLGSGPLGPRSQSAVTFCRHRER
jgi:hypothetical protein